MNASRRLDVRQGSFVIATENGTTSFTPENTVGTGAYRVTAFAAGRGTRLVRNDQYWSDPPNADELVIISIGAVTAMNMIGHLDRTDRRTLWATLAKRLAPGAPIVLNLQPPGSAIVQSDTGSPRSP